ncbi:MAG: TRAP transporter substrate-binding protein DctP [Rhodocyclaceae bacterium]
MKVFRLRNLAIGAALALGVSGAALAATTLVSAESQKSDHPVTQAQEFLARTLAERSAGDLVMQVKSGGELGSEPDVVDKLRKGDIAMGRVSMAILTETVPSVKLLSLPYLFRSREHMWSVLKGDFGKRLESELDQTGLVVVTFYDSGTRSFYSVKKPIRTRSDFVGLRVRVQPSPVYKDLINQLGGTPVVMQYDKVLDGLKNNEIDAAENNLPSYVSSEHYKYARYLSLDEHSMVPDVLLMSKKTWQKLTAQQQILLKQAAGQSSEYMTKLWAGKEREALDVARKAGVTILPKSQLAQTGIESFAVKLYTKYVQDDKDLETVLKIVGAK